MEHRYVLTKKPIETCGTTPARMDGVLLEDDAAATRKAKARHVMTIYSEEVGPGCGVYTPS